MTLRTGETNTNSKHTTNNGTATVGVAVRLVCYIVVCLCVFGSISAPLPRNPIHPFPSRLPVALGTLQKLGGVVKTWKTRIFEVSVPLLTRR